jgi:CheY-like chemotaxis protein
MHDRSYIVVVEDDYLQANLISAKLEQSFPVARIERISTELGFRCSLDDMAKDPPDVVIIDIMLRWTDPAPDLQTPPADVREEGFFRAGFRCERLLSEREGTREIPVILYTILTSTDLGQEIQYLRQNVTYLDKEASSEELIKLVRALMRC